MMMMDTTATAFVLQWGVMMAAMMLPSAAPAMLLYQTVRTKITADGETALPAWLFVVTYLALWTLLGVPVYATYAAASTLPPAWMAIVLMVAGIYQLTPAKRHCLTACESPLTFFMHRWRSGYAATLRLAVRHALYCVGCCWALMLVLVAAGAMGIWWVGAIAVVVFAEKTLPHGALTARIAGIILLLLGVAVLWRPALADAFRR